MQRPREDYVDTEELATEVKHAANGHRPDSVVLLVQAHRLPIAYLTAPSGVVQTKVISYPDLLAALDDSTVVAALNGAESRSISMPPLPANTLLVDLHESPTDNSYTVTGYLAPQSYLFVLEAKEQGETVTSTYEISLPHIVYSVRYEARKQAVVSFSLALCAADGGGGGSTAAVSAGLVAGEGPPPPQPDTPLYRYPFSNVFDLYGEALEGVCWPTMGSIKTSLADVPANIVRAFLELPNTNHDLFGRGESHNAPYSGYAELLAHIEREGLAEEYLIPAGLTVHGLHDQVRDLQEGT